MFEIVFICEAVFKFEVVFILEGVFIFDAISTTYKMKITAVMKTTSKSKDYLIKKMTTSKEFPNNVPSNVTYGSQLLYFGTIPALLYSAQLRTDCEAISVQLQLQLPTGTKLGKYAPITPDTNKVRHNSGHFSPH